MLRCMRCGQDFEPGSSDQTCCDNCCDEAPGFAEMARMAAECEPLTLEEAEWQKRQLEEAEMKEHPFLDD